ncbi:MAG: DUF1638 domain-containing protein [Desulfobacteraceae bacterium]|jgi:hypothetical protein|nr:DUF1638 domain-containing protein [Desulfobacteraceae bacterium]
MAEVSFADISIVSCGTLSLELNHLQQENLIDPAQVLYTTPGLHQDIHELEHQLVRQIQKAKEKTDKVLVVYGGKFCYVNADEPMRQMRTLIAEQGPGVVRIEATHCMDMLASETEREAIAQEMAGGEPVWWMTPGWVKFRKLVFKGWDKGLANENFPRHTGGAVVLDAIGYLDRYMTEKPEEFLEYCDWMGIPMVAYPVTFDRFLKLLNDQARKLHGQG